MKREQGRRTLQRPARSAIQYQADDATRAPASVPAGARDPDYSDHDAPDLSDEGRLGALWSEHRRWVAAVLLAHKPRDVDLEDLLQIVAEVVIRKGSTVRDPAAFRGWLRTVAVNAARLAGRETTRRQKGLRLVRDRVITERPEARRDETVLTPEEQEQAHRLMKLAQDLPEGYREPLLLRCVRGMSYREIAQVTGLKETTIETRIARGRRMLRELATTTQAVGKAKD